ncbi:MAG: hypothetical protein L6R40_006339 [Gallowayella cf. fulva]|nr:MAG: hypothetical protein L6R40_006339 [Xanthomendoza cf. fulva]
MAQVSPHILAWLHTVLSNKYHDVKRTYADVTHTLSTYSNLSIRTDVYTYENGYPALLLNIVGTLPVLFRGSTYMFPVSLWVPQEYPRTAPIIFVTPTKTMAVRAGQYVSVEGRVYHPYLAAWRDDDIFAREPPVISRQEHSQQPPVVPQQNSSIPPPVPPLPPELGRAESIYNPEGPHFHPYPPPRPPKGTENYAEGHSEQANGAPPVPPHPSRQALDTRHEASNKHAARQSLPPVIHNQQYQPQRISSLRNDRGPASQPGNQQITMHQPVPHPPTTVSPMTPPNNQTFQHQPSHSSSYPLPSTGVPQSQPALTARSASQAVWEQQAGYSHSQGLPRQLPASHHPPKPTQQDDLLTSPFEASLPAYAADIVPPPIPPNPRKDALLQALSQTLTQQIQSTHASNMSAIPPLRAQQAALNETLNDVNHEISQLNELQTLLDSNEKILRQAMLDADQVLEEAKRRDVPAVEEVLVAPTVVAGQLYENVVEERVLEECRSVIGRALDKGRIGGDVWAKQTRSLAREEFLKKALIKKIGRGMGLAEEDQWG